jgi:hypothetical protein
MYGMRRALFSLKLKDIIVPHAEALFFWYGVYWRRAHFGDIKLARIEIAMQMIIIFFKIIIVKFLSA